MDEPKMPWRGIARSTASVAAGFAALATWYSWGSVLMERREIARREAEASRPRWTDAARWERD